MDGSNLFCTVLLELLTVPSIIKNEPSSVNKNQKSSSLTLHLLNFFKGIIQIPFLKLSWVIIFRDIKMSTWSWSESTVQSLVRLHDSADWPGSVLVAKANHSQFQQEKGEKIIIVWEAYRLSYEGRTKPRPWNRSLACCGKMSDFNFSISFCIWNLENINYHIYIFILKITSAWNKSFN